MDIKYGIEYVWECSACKMRRIEMRAGGSGNGGGGGNGGNGNGARMAYAPSIEYVLWHVSCLARGYARDVERGHAAGGGRR